jgi:hypothetical protein
MLQVPSRSIVSRVQKDSKPDSCLAYFGTRIQQDFMQAVACPGLAPMLEISGLLGKAVLRKSVHAACTAVLSRFLNVFSWYKWEQGGVKKAADQTCNSNKVGFGFFSAAGSLPVMVKVSSNQAYLYLQARTLQRGAVCS